VFGSDLGDFLANARSDGAYCKNGPKDDRPVFWVDRGDRSMSFGYGKKAFPHLSWDDSKKWTAGRMMQAEWRQLRGRF